MSVPPELMQMIAGGAGKGAPAAVAPPGAAPQVGPAAAPMSTPQPAEGEKQSALANLSIAMDLMEQSLPALGSESDEGQTVLSVLSKLSSKFGHTRSKSQELIPAELSQLMNTLPKAQLPGGGAPPGMPPGMPH